jgi:hypothetical protein
MYDSKYGKRSITPGTVSRQTKFIEKESYSDHEDFGIDEEEETREIAEQLSQVRKRHDRIKEENLKKKKFLEKLKKDYEATQEMAQGEEFEEKMLKSHLENIQKSLEETRKQQKDEQNDRNTYLHMLDRMKKDKIAMEIKANSIQVSLKSTKQLLNTETEKYRKVRETHFQSRLILRELQKSFISERKIKDDKVQQLERNIKSRQEAASRREIRIKKQLEIAENAAKDDKDSHEVKLRECFLLNKLWQHYLNKKLEKEMNQAVQVEKAFKQIKLATGLNDIQEICERFLTREQSYLTLISAVNEAERKLEMLKMSNENSRDTLQKMQLEDVDSRYLYSEINKSDNKMLSLLKEYSGIKEKLQNSTKIYDQIVTWCGKIMKLLDIEREDQKEDSERKEYSQDLQEMLTVIYKKLEIMIDGLLQNKEESMRIIEKYASKKTSEIIHELTRDSSNGKSFKVKVENEESDELEEEVEEANRTTLESKDESKRKIKRINK